MLKNKKKKKKGFTLIELVIVLAVLAIIALIAIPNFTKVRNDSMTKSDIRSAEQIEKITQMAIADEDIIPGSSNKTITLTFGDNKRLASISGTGSNDKSNSYKEKLREVKAPQVNGKTTFVVLVNQTTGEVSVGYGGASTSAGAEWLVGPMATPATGN